VDGVPEDTYSDMWSTVVSDDIKSTANHSKLFRMGQCAETCRWLQFNKITFIHSSALVGLYAPNMQQTSLCYKTHVLMLFKETAFILRITKNLKENVEKCRMSN
jgi:hypothetical protein